MLQTANGRSASLLPPGILARLNAHRERKANIEQLKAMLIAELSDVTRHEAEGHYWAANQSRYNAADFAQALLNEGAIG